MPYDIFWQIHSDLPREGPGDNESTRRAFSMMSGLPQRPRVLDIACGPGMQTLELLRISDATVVAIDTHLPFLEELQRRALAAGVLNRVEARKESMFALPFEERAFDVIWCEGAMYIMGVEDALKAWSAFLKPRGFIAATEPCWLRDDVPGIVRDTWSEAYPGMNDIAGVSETIAKCGFREVGHFTIPDSAWWDDYYTPMEDRLTMLRSKYRGNAEALAGILEAQKEIDDHRRYSAYYGYVFFVVQKA
jgi:SAM-dependent methyltransferase